MFFVLLILNFFFINSIKHVFFKTKTIFQNSFFKRNFFLLKTQKIVLKNRFSEQFSKTTTKHTQRFCLQLFL